LARFGAGITGAIELIALRRALPQGADQTAPAAPIAINILSWRAKPRRDAGRLEAQGRRHVEGRGTRRL